MSRQILDEHLKQVPFLSAIGLTVESAKPGCVELRLPYVPQNTNHAGDFHSATLFGLGETAAAVALATHPDLGKLRHVQKVSHIQYIAVSRADVTARATVSKEMVQAILNEVQTKGHSRVEFPVQVLDGYSKDIAKITAVFGFKR